jgi:hypothetical protein
MERYLYFCRSIDNGLFDTVASTQLSGVQRLIMATHPYVLNGQLTKEQQELLFQRLDEREHKRLEKR